MESRFSLCRRPDGSRRRRWRYDNRMVDDSGLTLFAGKTPNGYLKKTVTFSDETGRSAVTFGANRSIAPSAFVLKDANATTLASIPKPAFPRLRSGLEFPVLAADGTELLRIVPAENVTKDELSRTVAIFQDDFILRRDDVILGYSGANPMDGRGESYAKKTVSRIGQDLLRGIKEIPGRFAALRAKQPVPEDVSAQLTLTAAGSDLDRRLVLALMLFRVHVFKEIRHPNEAWWQGGC